MLTLRTARVCRRISVAVLVWCCVLRVVQYLLQLSPRTDGYSTQHPPPFKKNVADSVAQRDASNNPRTRWTTDAPGLEDAALHTGWKQLLLPLAVVGKHQQHHGAQLEAVSFGIPVRNSCCFTLRQQRPIHRRGHTPPTIRSSTPWGRAGSGRTKATWFVIPMHAPYIYI